MRLETTVIIGVFLLVALNHMYAVFHQEQSKWKGGGFGMFSSAESYEIRFKVLNSLDNRRYSILLDDFLRKEIERIEIKPNKEKWRDICNRLSRSHLYKVNESELISLNEKITLPSKKKKALKSFSLTSEMWKREVFKDSTGKLKVKWEKLDAIEIEVPDNSN